MKICKKGTYGYIKSQTKIEILKTLSMLIISFALYGIGIYSTGSNKNLLTYVAILGCLPMAKFAVNVVMFKKAKGCSEKVHELVVSSGAEPTFWDMYFTAYKKNYQVSCMYYKKNTLIGLTEDSKTVPEEAEKHITEILKNAGITNATVKIFTEPDKFISRTKELSLLEEDSKDLTLLYDNLLNVTL